MVRRARVIFGAVMTSSRACVVAALMVSALFASPAMSQSRPHAPPVSLDRTELHGLHSDRVGSDFQIRVRLPDSYTSPAHVSRRYPVVYLLDGDLLFGLTSDVLQYLEWGGLVPEVILVAPAYGSIHSPENGGTNMRARDFSVFPSQAGYVAGGGQRFLSFLREELMPFVHRQFRVDTADRTLIGFSRGADLTVYALFTASDAFTRYVALDNFYSDYLQLEQAYAATHKDLPKKVYLSGRFPNAWISALADKLDSRGYPGLALEYADAHPRHFAVPADGITRGLISVFGGKSLLALLLPLVTRGETDSAIAEYRRLKATAARYDFGEAELSDVGMALAQMRRFDDAIRVYRLNLENHPRSGITLRRLGHAYEQLGDTAKALDSYRAALHSNPGDAAAAAAARRLQRRSRP